MTNIILVVCFFFDVSLSLGGLKHNNLHFQDFTRVNTQIDLVSIKRDLTTGDIENISLELEKKRKLVESSDELEDLFFLHLDVFDELFKRDNYAEALFFLRKAELYVKDDNAIAEIYIRFAKLRALKGCHEDSVVYYNKAISLYSQSENPSNFTEKLTRLYALKALELKKINKNNDAFLCAYKAIHTYANAFNYINLSKLYAMDCNEDKALFYIEKAKKYVLNQEEKIELLSVEAKVYFLQENYEWVLDNCYAVIDLLKQGAGNLKQYQRIYKTLYLAYGQLGDYEKRETVNALFLKHQKDYRKATDKLSAVAIKPLYFRNLRNIQECSSTIPYYYYSVLVLFFSTLFFFSVKKKNTLRKNEEIIKQQVFIIKKRNEVIRELEQKINDSSLKDLMFLAKTNDPFFLTRFSEVYPEAYQKLLGLRPKLVQTELAFCAMVWLNFSSKDIARFTYVQPKTVQVKKHRLRKKLNIPRSDDFYVWIRNV